MLAIKPIWFLCARHLYWYKSCKIREGMFLQKPEVQESIKYTLRSRVHWVPASHLLQNSVLFDDRGHLVVQYFVTTVSSCFFLKPGPCSYLELARIWSGMDNPSPSEIRCLYWPLIIKCTPPIAYACSDAAWENMGIDAEKTRILFVHKKQLKNEAIKKNWTFQCFQCLLSLTVCGYLAKLCVKNLVYWTDSGA